MSIQLYTLASELEHQDDLDVFLDQVDVNTLRSLRDFASTTYHNGEEEPILSDQTYDSIVDYIKRKDPSYVPPVGAPLREADNRTKLPYWLGSANKITPNDPDMLERWIQKHPSSSYIVSDKLDGVSCLLSFRNGILKLYTRGDGIIGGDITHLVNFFRLPKLIKPIAVRGELILSKKTFETKYKNNVINGRKYKNARNMVAGLIGGKTTRQGLEDIQFVVYEIVGDSLPKPSTQLTELKKLGFQVVEYKSLNDVRMEKLIETITKAKDKSEYEIDGIIVQPDVPYDRNTSGNPDYLIAFKKMFSEDIRTVEVKEIEWQTSKWGQLKPVVIMKTPVEILGATIERATAHNAKYVEDFKLGPGAIIRLTRSNSVIPYIIDVEKPAERASMPTIPYIWDKNHVNVSVKEHTNNMEVKLISDFFNKLGIKHVSEATVEKMFNNRLNNLFKIITANKERLLQVPEFQEKSAERIFTNIREGLKNVKIHVLIGSSGMLGYGIGVKRVESLFRDIPDLLTRYKTQSSRENVNMIKKVDGCSDIIAEKIAKNLKYADKFMTKIGPFITVKETKRVSDDMKGEKVVTSGFRSKELEEQIQSRGGQVVGSISKNTTALVVKDKNEASGKINKAKELGVPIYTKEEFENRM